MEMHTKFYSCRKWERIQRFVPTSEKSITNFVPKIAKKAYQILNR